MTSIGSLVETYRSMSARSGLTPPPRFLSMKNDQGNQVRMVKTMSDEISIQPIKNNELNESLDREILFNQSSVNVMVK